MGTRRPNRSSKAERSPSLSVSSPEEKTKTIIKTTKRKKKITEIQTQTTTTITTTTKSKRTPTKRVKKTYKKAGQKKDTPGDMNGNFIFYDSLFKERPNSQMAQIWLMEHGCFSDKKQLALAKKIWQDTIGKEGGSKKKTEA